MPSGDRGRLPPLTVIREDQQGGVAARTGSVRELDWSMLMARAQGGDRDAYRRLLGEITPCLRTLAARRHRDVSDAEDAVQDILLTVHAIRHL
jgi:RNA polymerase sigma-70 factor (ECF subfamily)